MEHVDISTTFVGLSIPSPIIASSSGMTTNIGQLMTMESMGIGAVVLKSIFEEQIEQEIGSLSSDGDHPEAHDYISKYMFQSHLDELVAFVSEAKRQLHIPVIASICCFRAGQWVSFAKRLQLAGADAIELNIYVLPKNPFQESAEIEQYYFDIVQDVRAEVYVPLIVKIGSSFTNLPAFVDLLRGYGANAVTIFNRFYEPDINLDTLQFKSSPMLGASRNLYSVLRWTGLLRSLSSGAPMQISASSGVYKGEDVVKLLLVGADSVQICSALYKYGFSVIGNMNNLLKQWMLQNSFSKISQWKGMLSYAESDDPERFERTQFMKYTDKKTDIE